MTLKPPVRIAVTGAAGQIAYATLFRIAGGIMLGRDQPVILQLLDLPQAQQALRGVIMEMQDCAFPLLADIFATDDPEVAFKDADIALLIGARPRTQGMERADLLHANAEIFKVQGAALNKVANRNVKVLVVGNPANTNAYIAMKSAPDIPPENFTALMRLDHHRAVSQVAEKINRPIPSIEQMCVWGNHSPTMYADYRYATSNGESVQDMITEPDWNTEVFMPKIAGRGAAIIAARGSSSAASAANAAIYPLRDGLRAQRTLSWSRSAARCRYGRPAGSASHRPCRCRRRFSASSSPQRDRRGRFPSRAAGRPAHPRGPLTGNM